MEMRTSALCVLVVCLGCFFLHTSMLYGQDLPQDSSLSETERALLRRADKIVVKVGQLRGLPPLGPVRKGIKDRETLRLALERKLNEEYSSEEMRAEARVLSRLGLIPQEMDLGQFIIDLLTEQIAGYYDTDSKELNIIREENPVSQDAAMAHELFHALQDQHFTLSSVHPPETGLGGSRMNPDRAVARSALIEGDATVLMMDFVLSQTGAIPLGKGASFIDNPMLARVVDSQMDALNASIAGLPGSLLSKAPRVFQHELQFPYVAGLRFVRAVRERRTWSDVDAIYRDPPNSTEQILHPKRYLQRDEPTLVWLDGDALRRALPKTSKEPAWVVEYNATMGELRTRLWLEELLIHRAKEIGIQPWSLETIHDAAEGWDGDRLLGIFSPSYGVVLVHHSIWDTERDANEFFNSMSALSRIHTTSAPIYTQTGRKGGAHLFRKEGRAVYSEYWGNEVLYIDLPDERTASALQDLVRIVWETRRTGPYPTSVTSPQDP